MPNLCPPRVIPAPTPAFICAITIRLPIFRMCENDSSQAANIVPFTQFAIDLANNALPQYSFIVPNIMDDAHTGSLAQADSWLQSNIAPLLASPAFQSSGLLIITFDEGDQSDVAHGGGQVATLIISSQAKKGYRSQTLYQHQSTLRLTLASSGVEHLSRHGRQRSRYDGVLHRTLEVNGNMHL